MHEQRSGQRRNCAIIRTFPLADDRGCSVLFDRSRMPDRQLHSLKPAETGVHYHRQLRMTC